MQAARVAVLALLIAAVAGRSLQQTFVGGCAGVEAGAERIQCCIQNRDDPACGGGQDPVVGGCAGVAPEEREQCCIENPASSGCLVPTPAEPQPDVITAIVEGSEDMIVAPAPEPEMDP